MAERPITRAINEIKGKSLSASEMAELLGEFTQIDPRHPVPTTPEMFSEEPEQPEVRPLKANGRNRVANARRRKAAEPRRYEERPEREAELEQEAPSAAPSEVEEALEVQFGPLAAGYPASVRHRAAWTVAQAYLELVNQTPAAGGLNNELLELVRAAVQLHALGKNADWTDWREAAYTLLGRIDEE